MSNRIAVAAAVVVIGCSSSSHPLPPSQSRESAVAPLPTPTPTPAPGPASADPLPAPDPAAAYLVWIRPTGAKAPAPYTDLLDAHGTAIGHADGIWVASDDALWRIVRNDRKTVVTCGGKTVKGSALELTAVTSDHAHSLALLAPTSPVVSHVARIDASIGPYLFVSATDQACPGDATTDSTAVIDLSTQQPVTGIDATDAATLWTARAQLPRPLAVAAVMTAEAERAAAERAAAGESSGVPRRWGSVFSSDDDLRAAMANALGDEMAFTDCLSTCGWNIGGIDCNRTTGKCTLNGSDLAVHAGRTAAAALIAVLAHRDLVDGVAGTKAARCSDNRCTEVAIGCEWERDRGNSSCSETIR